MNETGKCPFLTFVAVVDYFQHLAEGHGHAYGQFEGVFSVTDNKSMPETRLYPMGSPVSSSYSLSISQMPTSPRPFYVPP